MRSDWESVEVGNRSGGAEGLNHQGTVLLQQDLCDCLVYDDKMQH